ncbi:hypothetical protein ACFO3J_35020 [Streptomyces polygonati]|uniref:Uncharacterized protein n=1 Tax=Streptomyces polygonati TaxID=1617087 RepID=A0ABV8I291_9ACTN
MSAAPYEPISADIDPAEIQKASQDGRQQFEGYGLRVANKAEFSLIAPVIQPGGAAVFRERAIKAQYEAGFWEGRLGTVHDLRVGLVNNDTQILFAATYSDDFKPYVADVIKFASPWIDHMFVGVAEGYPGLTHPSAVDYILKYQVQASVWYASNPEASPRNIAKGLRLSAVFDDLLDVAQS